MGKKEKISIIIITLFYIGLTIYSFISNKYEALIVISVLLIFLIIFMIFSNIGLKKNNKLDKKINKKYHTLKEKITRNLFEECYVLSIRKELGKRVYDKVKLNNIKDVSSIYSSITELNVVNLYYRFRGFEVCIVIKENSVSYKITPPNRYEGTKNTKILKLKTKASFSTKEFNNIDSFIDSIYKLIIDINVKIESFILNNKTDETVNGIMLKKIKPVQDLLKMEGLFCVIFLSIVLILAVVGIFDLVMKFNSNLNNHDSFILELLTYLIICSLLCIFIVRGAFVLRRYIYSKNDFEHKSYSIIEESPKRVKIIKEQNRQAPSYIRIIILYFEEFKVYIPVPALTSLIHGGNIDIFYNECLKVKCKLKYLTKSKIVFDGENKYISLLREYLC